MNDDVGKTPNRTARWVGLAVAAVAVAALLLWIGSMVLESRSSIAKLKATSEARPATGTPAPAVSVPTVPMAQIPGAVRDPGRPEPVEMQPAVLFQCYDHFRENVPPRNDTSARQKDWTVPPTPVEFAKEKLAGPKATPEDKQLLQWLTSWDAAWRQGRPASPDDTARLEELLASSAQPFDTLFEIGRGVHYLEGPELALVFYKAALTAAERDYAKDLSPVHPAAATLRAALPQLGFCWDRNDYATLERRFRLEAAVHPPLSIESRKCTHSCAEAMFYQQKYKEAAALIDEKKKRDEQAGDLTESDKYEMGWIYGLFYSVAGRFDDAIEPLKVAAQPGKYHTQMARQLLINTLQRAGKTEQLEAAMKEYGQDEIRIRQ